MIAQEDQAALLLSIPDFYPPEEVLPPFPGQTIEANDLVGEHLTASWHRPPFHHQVISVLFQARHPVHALPRQLQEPLIIHVSTIEYQNRPRFPAQLPSHVQLVSSAIGDHGKARQVAVMIE